MHETTSRDASSGPDYTRSAPARPTAREAGRRPRLLIVEDDPMTGDMLGRFFGRLGWDVMLSMTVQGGLALLTNRPDCAILDLNLPDGDGETVLAAIRQSGMPTRVVVASATNDRDLLERVARLCPERLLSKPVFVDDILQAFGEVC